MARRHEGWRERRCRQRAGAPAVTHLHQALPRYSQGAPRHRQHLHEHCRQHAGTGQCRHAPWPEGDGTDAGAEHEERHGIEPDDYVLSAEHQRPDADSRQHHGIPRPAACRTTHGHLHPHPAGNVLLDAGGHHCHLALPAHQPAEPHDSADAGWRMRRSSRHHLGLFADVARHHEPRQHHRCQHPADEHYLQLHPGRCTKEGQRLRCLHRGCQGRFYDCRAHHPLLGRHSCGHRCFPCLWGYGHADWGHALVC